MHIDGFDARAFMIILCLIYIILSCLSFTVLKAAVTEHCHFVICKIELLNDVFDLDFGPL